MGVPGRFRADSLRPGRSGSQGLFAEYARLYVAANTRLCSVTRCASRTTPADSTGRSGYRTSSVWGPHRERGASACRRTRTRSASTWIAAPIGGACRNRTGSSSATSPIRGTSAIRCSPGTSRTRSREKSIAIGFRPAGWRTALWPLARNELLDFGSGVVQCLLGPDSVPAGWTRARSSSPVSQRTSHSPASARRSGSAMPASTSAPTSLRRRPPRLAGVEHHRQHGANCPGPPLQPGTCNMHGHAVHVQA